MPSGTLVTSKVILPSAPPQTVGSDFVKLDATKVPPVVPLTLISTSEAPVELIIISAGLDEGAVPSIAMKMEVSTRPVESGLICNRLEYVPFNDVLT